ncbi:MAG: hypothetical protein ABSB09_12760 [Acidimicrobiales bacterium]|jgi:hypothetical protein
MSQNLEARIRGHQPPLPLVDAEPPDDTTTAAAAPDTDTGATDAVTDAEWRLDEHTRLVGRMGIAAARAHLKKGPTPAGPRGTTPGRRAPGRAA